MLHQAGLPLRDIAEYGNGNFLPGAAAGHIAQRLLLRHTQGPVQGCDILLGSPLLKVEHTAEDICAVGNDLHDALPIFCLRQLPGFHGIALREGAIEVPDADTRRAGYAGQLLQGLALLGIHGADRHSHQQHHPAQSTDPDFWALPPGHIANSSLGVSLAKSQRHPGENTLMGRQPQQGLGIIRPDLLPQSFQHRFVTAQLHVLPGQAEGQPGKGVEPMEAQGQVGQGFPYRIHPADMVALMGQDKRALFFRRFRRKIDVRAKEPHHKGRGDPVT